MDNSYLGNFQMLGISSGIDTASMIDALMKAERKPLERAEAKYNDISLKRNLWIEIDDKLTEFWDNTMNLRLPSSINSKTAISSNESALSAITSADSTNSSFYVKINNLATSTSRRFSNSLNIDYNKIATNTKFSELNHNVTPETGTYTINYNDGTDKSFELNIDNATTIQNIIDQIDTGSGSKLSAELIDGKLSISDNTAGTVTDISLGSTTDTSNFSEVFDMAFSTYDGAKIESISDVIDYSTMRLYELTNLTESSTININGTDIAISQNSKIEDVLSQVNNSEAGVVMSFDSSTKQFTIKNNETGPRELNIIDDATTNILSTFGMTAGDTVQAGEKAEVEIFNSEADTTPITTITSWDNLVEYNNTNLDLKKTTTDKVNIEITQDTEKAMENIQDFVDKYNETMEYLYEKLHEEKVTDVPEEEMTDEQKMQGSLKGDRTLERIFYQMRSIAYKTLDWDVTNSGDTMPEYSSLNEIGITSGDTGSSYDNTMKGLLSINEDKLKAALENNSEDVYKLFSHSNTFTVAGETESNNGIITDMREYIWDTTKFGGTIYSISGSSGSLGKQMMNLADRMTNMLDQLQRKEYRYVQQFSAMEQSISRMNSQMSYLQSRLGG